MLKRAVVGKARAIDYDADLNEAQRKAVMTTEGPLLIVAGAGTGKTRTLVYRVARLVEIGAKPESILLLTFTRRAAASMLTRAAALADARCQRVSRRFIRWVTRSGKFAEQAGVQQLHRAGPKRHRRRNRSHAKTSEAKRAAIFRVSELSPQSSA